MLFNAIKGDLRAGVIVTLTEGTQVTHCTEMCQDLTDLLAQRLQEPSEGGASTSTWPRSPGLPHRALPPRPWAPSPGASPGAVAACPRAGGAISLLSVSTHSPFSTEGCPTCDVKGPLEPAPMSLLELKDGVPGP